MAFTYTRTGNQFVVINPAPSVESFFSGEASIRNENDLNVTLVCSEYDRDDQASVTDGALTLDYAPVYVKMDYHSRGFYAKASGTYTGEGSELWLTM